MAHIKGIDRNQGVLFPEYLDDYIEPDAPVRLFDAFVGSLRLGKMGFTNVSPSQVGHPSYDPATLLKVLLYGYFYGVRSSRKLARECRCNVELMWLTGKLFPDFRTLSDFRKDNISHMEEVFKEFNRFCIRKAILSKSYISIDGSKFKAVNAKDQNFTRSKLDDRLAYLNKNIHAYMKALEEADAEEADERKLSREEIKAKLQELGERKARYEGYLAEMEKTGATQKSVTDPESRLMKCNEGFCVGYNTQTAVDADTHMVVGINVVDSPTDHGQITELAKQVKETMGVDTIEAVADKGYVCSSDTASALENGIVPNVIQMDGSSEINATFEYEEGQVSAEQLASTAPEDIKACLRSGNVPDIYKDILSDPKIIETTHSEYVANDGDILQLSAAQMKETAMKGYFVRDPKRNLVYCPQGCVLRQKCINAQGQIIYYNRLACLRCKHKCTSSPRKEVAFSKDMLVRSCGKVLKGKDAATVLGVENVPFQKTTVRKKFVRYRFKLDEKKMVQRKCLSEHPFGTVKRSLSGSYLLLKGKAKATGEMSLMFLAYNLRRAITMKGVGELVESLA